MHKHLLLIILTFIAPATFAQLSGTYTIGGTTPDYTTISAAVSDLESNGVNGPVVLNLRPGIYTEQIFIGTISGVSEVNTITFQSEDLDSTSVSIEYSANSAANYTIRINLCDHLIFQYLTIRALNTAYNRAIYLLGSSKNTFRHNQFTSTVSMQNNSRRLLDIYSSASTPSDSILIENNRFYKGGYQIYMSPSNGSIILNNVFEGPNGTSIYASEQSDLLIEKNVFTDISTAIDLRLCNDVYISKNKLVGGVNVISISQSHPLPTAPIRIVNNFVSSNGTSLHLNYSSNIQTYNNSFYTASSSQACVYVTNTYSGYELKNNIFKNMGGTFYKFQGGPSAVDTSSFHSDYNGFFTESTDKFATNSGTYSFSNWQNLVHADTNSLFADPQYISNIDLHINNAIEYNNVGIDLGVTSDIDDQPRLSASPDLGADEYDIDPNTFHDLELLRVAHPDTTLCILENSVAVEIVNHSLFPIDSFDIQWWLFGTSMGSSTYYATIAPMDTIIVNIAPLTFNINTAYDMDFVLSAPNGMSDNNPLNNDSSIRYYHIENSAISQRTPTDCSDEIELYIKNFPRSGIVWSTGATTDSILVPSTPGSYSVTVTHENGCTSTDTININ